MSGKKREEYINDIVEYFMMSEDDIENRYEWLEEKLNEVWEEAWNRGACVQSEIKLTDKQYKLLEYMKEYDDEHGYMPTQREVGEEFGVRDNAVCMMLDRIEKKGGIERTSHQFRGVRILVDLE